MSLKSCMVLYVPHGTEINLYLWYSIYTIYVCSRIARSIAGVYNRGAIFVCTHQGRICYI